jgi:hypothetical protein
MPTIPSKLRLMGGTGRHPMQRALDVALRNDQKPIVRPGVGFDIFTSRDDTTGDDEIYLLVHEQAYAWFEQMARLCRLTVDAFAYAALADKMRLYGFNVSADRFYVTTELPDLPFMGQPPAIKRNLN